MHPAAKDFLDNIERYLLSDFGSFVLHCSEQYQRRGIELRGTPIIEEAKKLVYKEGLWDNILAHLKEFTVEELEQINAMMPGGWARTKVAERLEQLLSQEYLKHPPPGLLKDGGGQSEEKS